VNEGFNAWGEKFRKGENEAVQHLGSLVPRIETEGREVGGEGKSKNTMGRTSSKI